MGSDAGGAGGGLRVEPSDWLTDAGYAPTPDRIRFDQEEAIAEALEALGGSGTADEIAAEAVLPASVVSKRAADCPELFQVDGDRIALRDA